MYKNIQQYICKKLTIGIYGIMSVFIVQILLMFIVGIIGLVLSDTILAVSVHNVIDCFLDVCLIVDKCLLVATAICVAIMSVVCAFYENIC